MEPAANNGDGLYRPEAGAGEAEDAGAVSSQLLYRGGDCPREKDASVRLGKVTADGDGARCAATGESGEALAVRSMRSTTRSETAGGGGGRGDAASPDAARELRKDERNDDRTSDCAVRDEDAAAADAAAVRVGDDSAEKVCRADSAPGRGREDTEP